MESVSALQFILWQMKKLCSMNFAIRLLIILQVGIYGQTNENVENYEMTFYNRPMFYSSESTTTIECTFSYTGDITGLSVSWTLNGMQWTRSPTSEPSAVDVSTNPTRYKSSITVAPSTDAGEYVCKVSGPFGTAVSNPTILKHITLSPGVTKTLRYTDYVSLGCLMEGDNPGLDIQWKIDGNIIKVDATEYYYAVSPNGKLFVINNPRAPGGNRKFNCEINGPGLRSPIAGNEHTILVIQAYAAVPLWNQIVENSKDRQTVFINEPFSIFCAAIVQYDDQPSWSFTESTSTSQRDIWELQLAGLIARQYSRELFVSQATTQYDGVYRCQYSRFPNGAVEFTINVESKPEFLQKPQDDRFVIGKILHLSCDYTNIAPHTPTQIDWMKDGIQLTSSSSTNIGENGKTLELRNISEKKPFMIQCKLSYLHVWTIHNAKISYGGAVPSVIPASSSTVFALQSQRVELPCGIQGDPTPTYLWQPVTDDAQRGEHYVIQAATKSLENVYTCSAKNEHGSFERKIYFKVAASPGPQVSFSPPNGAWSTTPLYNDADVNKVVIFSPGSYEVHCAKESGNPATITRRTTPLTAVQDFYAMTFTNVESKQVEDYECKNTDNVNIGLPLQIIKIKEEKIVEFKTSLNRNGQVVVCLGPENIYELIKASNGKCYGLYNVTYYPRGSREKMVKDIPCNAWCITLDNLKQGLSYEFILNLQINGEIGAKSEVRTIDIPLLGLGPGPIAAISIAVVLVLASVILAILFRKRLLIAVGTLRIPSTIFRTKSTQPVAMELTNS